MASLIKCSYCSEEITDDSDFCPHCGALYIRDAEIYCDEHPQNKAGGVCIICHKVCCDECGVEVDGRSFCLVHQNVKVEQDWAEVFESSEISDAEMVKSFLESIGHKVLGHNFNSMGFIWGGGGDSPVSRSNINKPVRVFVPIPEYLDAARELEEWRSSQTDIGMDYARIDP
ncbi:MAG: zinc-ribbon domain-containing protein [Bacteroidetes bacterium]|nr:zinc-ribbon domain-containing protein [Bacteroidota bacterium]